MNLNETFDDLDFEKFEIEFEKQWKIKHQQAVKWLWNLTNFKRFISQFLKRNNSEDQWTSDYKSWVDSIIINKYEHPSSWAKEYYQNDWNLEAVNKSIQSLGKIAERK